MSADFRKVVHAAAPQPSAAPDVDSLWQRARKQRVARRVVAVCLSMVLAATAWTVVRGGLSSSLGQDHRAGPAGQGEGESASPDPGASTGTLYLENACRNIGECNLTAVDLSTGATRSVAVPELAIGDASYRIVRSGSKLVFRGSTARSTGSEVATFTLDLDLQEPARSIGESWYFVPSTTEGRVWLAILDPDSPATERALEAVEEVTVEGEVTVPSTALPAGRWSALEGAVQGALVFQGPDGLDVWDPVEDEMVMRLAGPFLQDTHGSLIAWCDQGCAELHITDVASGDDVIVPAGADFAFEESYEGVFSPDGSQLAVPVVSEGRNHVALVDVTQGSVGLIEGSRRDEFYGSMTWASSGDWLFFNAGEGKIMSYRSGSEGAEPLPFRIEGQVSGMAAD